MKWWRVCQLALHDNFKLHVNHLDPLESAGWWIYHWRFRWFDQFYFLLFYPMLTLIHHFTPWNSYYDRGFSIYFGPLAGKKIVLRLMNKAFTENIPITLKCLEHESFPLLVTPPLKRERERSRETCPSLQCSIDRLDLLYAPFPITQSICIS